MWAVTEKIKVSRISVLLSIPFIIVGFFSVLNVTSLKKDCYKENALFMLDEYLEDNNLEYGYATFWNANSITVISDSKVCTIINNEDPAYMGSLKSDASKRHATALCGYLFFLDDTSLRK